MEVVILNKKLFEFLVDSIIFQNLVDYHNFPTYHCIY